MNDQKPINFAAEVKKRTGRTLDEEKIRRDALGMKPLPDVDPDRMHVNPEDDRIVKLAMDVLELVRKHQNEKHNPVLILAALHVAGSAVGQEYILNYGEKKTAELVAKAQQLSSQYEAGFHGKQMDRDQEDKP